MRPLAVLAACLASCATVSTRQPIRIAITDIESKESLGGPSLAAAVREHLQNGLAASGRFRVLERRRLEPPPTPGRLEGADWIAYGVITPEDGGACVHVRFVRTDTGALAYSRGHSVSGSDAAALCTSAQQAVAEMVREFESTIPR